MFLSTTAEECNQKVILPFSLTTNLSATQVIPAFEEAILGMKPGGIRRLIVPTDIGYPDNDWRKKGRLHEKTLVRHLLSKLPQHHPSD